MISTQKILPRVCVYKQIERKQAIADVRTSSNVEKVLTSDSEMNQTTSFSCKREREERKQANLYISQTVQTVVIFSTATDASLKHTKGREYFEIYSQEIKRIRWMPRR